MRLEKGPDSRFLSLLCGVVLCGVLFTNDENWKKLKYSKTKA